MISGITVLKPLNFRHTEGRDDFDALQENSQLDYRRCMRKGNNKLLEMVSERDEVD